MATRSADPHRPHTIYCSLLSLACRSRLFDCAVSESLADHLDGSLPCDLADVLYPKFKPECFVCMFLLF